jgi:CDP-glycerol glycerophosphotransferase (TagB/SpsB family)
MARFYATLRRWFPFRTLLRVGAARLGGSLAMLRPVQNRIYIAAPHDRALRGSLRLIHDKLSCTTPVPNLLVECRSAIQALDHIAIARSISGLILTMRGAYRVASSRVILVDDYYFSIYPIARRPGTTIVQVWHASGAFKRFGRATVGKGWGADTDFIRHVPIHSNYDLALVSSASVAPAYAEAFGAPVEIFTARFGMPNTDPLIDPVQSATSREQIRTKLGIGSDEIAVLWAPTFRGPSILEAAAPVDLDLELLMSRLSPKHRLILRMHPFVQKSLNIPAALRDRVVDASSEEDINSVLLAGDILVSDYSSLIYEFSLLGRPIALFAPDLDKYEQERGFFFDYRTGVPGPVFAETSELAAWISAATFDLERVRAFAARSFDRADGHATERLVEQVILPAYAKRG